ncbi:MAG: hypothetical protein RLY31_3163 [Bacteroidota bacterium]|jgi:MFS family permease
MPRSDHSDERTAARRTDDWQVSLFALTGAFLTYCSMYAFRKPFTAGAYAEQDLWGIDYKILLVSAQVVGYMLSKFVGIKVISEMPANLRIRYILGLIGLSWSALFLFAWMPRPWNIAALFLNGLPLGMIWGLVFAFLEGRRHTELLGAGLCVSFIVSSGMVKAAGLFLMGNLGVPEYWMPFWTGLLFMPMLLGGTWILSRIPPPSVQDKALRSERVPMDGRQRRAFLRTFMPGVLLLVSVYVAITIFRDLRDNFAVELWEQLGYGDVPSLLVTAEIPIALAVFLLIGAMIFVQDNRTAFYLNLGVVLAGGLVLLSSTWLFQRSLLPPAAWMILAGFGLYLAYVSFHTLLFERWMAYFRARGNIGFLMYTADAFGYLGSVGILFIKHFGQPAGNWLAYTRRAGIVIGLLTVVFSLLAFAYFRQKEKRYIPKGLRQAAHPT